MNGKREDGSEKNDSTIILKVCSHVHFEIIRESK